jgi:predicted nucleic acid-binding protein
VIVVDSSVWVDLLRDVASPQVAKLIRLLPAQPLIVGDLILCEVLRGARSEGEAVRIRARLGAFSMPSMVGQTVAEQAAAHVRALRAQGITVRSTVDLLIGTFCIVQGYRLLHNDRDFRPMVEHMGLLEA